MVVQFVYTFNNKYPSMVFSQLEEGFKYSILNFSIEPYVKGQFHEVSTPNFFVNYLLHLCP